MKSRGICAPKELSVRGSFAKYSTFGTTDGRRSEMHFVRRDVASIFGEFVKDDKTATFLDQKMFRILPRLTSWTNFCPKC